MNTQTHTTNCHIHYHQNNRRSILLKLLLAQCIDWSEFWDSLIRSTLKKETTWYRKASILSKETCKYLFTLDSVKFNSPRKYNAIIRLTVIDKVRLEFRVASESKWHSLFKGSVLEFSVVEWNFFILFTFLSLELRHSKSNERKSEKLWKVIKIDKVIRSYGHALI